MKYERKINIIRLSMYLLSTLTGEGTLKSYRNFKYKHSMEYGSNMIINNKTIK